MPAGTIYWQTNLAPVIENNEVTQIVGIARDVTERQKRERELERHQAYLESARDAITVIDADGVIQYESPAIEEVLGYEPDERIGENGFEYIHPDDREPAIESFQQSLNEGPESESVELRLRHKDGSWRWINNRPSYYLNDPAIQGIVTSLRDVTERRRREVELEKLREQTKCALEETDTIVFTWNPETGEATTLYQEIEDLVGIDSSTVEGLGGFMNQVVHPEDRSRLTTAYEQVVQGETDRLNVEFRTDPDIGRQQWLSVKGYLRSDSGSVQMVGLIADITDHKEHELELERQNQRLDEFASVVSHDLRNPLNVATGRLGLAREEVENEHLDAIERAHNRMQSLIDDVLALAEKGEAISELQSVALEDVIEECWANVETNQASLDVDSTQTIRADKSRLRQLLENLIRNAVEHGGENVTVSVGDMDGGFYVEDDGVGIPEDKRSEVVEAGTSTDPEGTGFGLSIVREIAQAHDWRFEITSSPVGGARFEFKNVQTA